MSGIRAVVSLAIAAGVLAGCNYGFSGGGGFPAEIRTMFIQSFENQTPQFELETRIFQRLQERVPRALGVRPGGEANADAMLRGRITQYNDAAVNSRPNSASQTGVEVLAHQVQITVSVQLINRRNNTLLWEGTITGRGEYDPQNQTDVAAWDTAINHLIQQIIDGAQSQW